MLARRVDDQVDRLRPRRRASSSTPSSSGWRSSRRCSPARRQGLVAAALAGPDPAERRRRGRETRCPHGADAALSRTGRRPRLTSGARCAKCRSARRFDRNRRRVRSVASPADSGDPSYAETMVRGPLSRASCPRRSPAAHRRQGVGGWCDVAGHESSIGRVVQKWMVTVALTRRRVCAMLCSSRGGTKWTNDADADRGGDGSRSAVPRSVASPGARRHPKPAPQRSRHHRHRPPRRSRSSSHPPLCK